MFILVLLSQPIHSQCGLGCLSCTSPTSNTSASCQICDLDNFYLLNTETNLCERKIISNCESLKLNGDCFRCAPGYYFNATECVPVTAAKLVTNCAYYTPESNCQFCLPDYYFDSQTGQCRIVQTIIPNCAINTQDSCQLCRFGFKLTADETQCVLLEAGDNCLDSSFYFCNECGSDSQTVLKSLNAFLYSLSTVEHIRNQLQLQLTENSTYKSQCVLSPDNCRGLDELGGCNACVEGYYLNTLGKCIKNPDDIVFNCNVYSSDLTCQSCLSNFYLENNTCKAYPDTLANKCTEVQVVGQTVQCLTCGLAYVLSNGECVDRTSIQNCQIHKVNVNDCEQCIENYIRSTDTTQSVNICTPRIPDCDSMDFNADGTAKDCTQCKAKYVLKTDSSNQCELASETKCLYWNSSRKCSRCEDDYVLEGESCVDRLYKDANCAEYAV